MLSSCYDSILITEPETFHNQSISIFLGLEYSCYSPGNPAFPSHRYLKSSVPQMPAPAIEIIYAVLAGSLISYGFGK